MTELTDGVDVAELTLDKVLALDFSVKTDADSYLNNEAVLRQIDF